MFLAITIKIITSEKNRWNNNDNSNNNNDSNYDNNNDPKSRL